MLSFALEVTNMSILSPCLEFVNHWAPIRGLVAKPELAHGPNSADSQPTDQPDRVLRPR